MDDPKNPVLNPIDPGVTPGQAPPADPPTPTPPSTDLPDVPPAPPVPETGPFTPPMEDPGFPMPPAPQIETPQSDVPNPEEQPSETGPPASERGGLPPVIAPPSTSGPKAKIIASIIGLVLLVISIPAGIFLVKQQQEIRSQAGGSPGLNDPCAPDTSTTTVCAPNLHCVSGQCKHNNGTNECCSTDDPRYCTNRGLTCTGSDSNCASGNKCVTPTGGVVGGGGGTVTVGWGSGCGEAQCQGGQSLSCRPSDVEGKPSKCLKGKADISVPGECKDQSECVDHSTCSNGKCLWNSGSEAGKGCCSPGLVNSQCTSPQTCSQTNANCESGLSCGTGTEVAALTWGARCNDASDGRCESGTKCLVDQDNTKAQGTNIFRCLKPPTTITVPNACKDQSECLKNATCSSGKCLWNSGIIVAAAPTGCCGTNTFCADRGLTCSQTNANCESGLSCGTGTSTKCKVDKFKVYKFPYGDGDEVDETTFPFKAGDSVRFVARVPANATGVQIEICEASRPCQTLPAANTGGPPAPIVSTYKYWRDLTIHTDSVGSVSARAQCTF